MYIIRSYAEKNLSFSSFNFIDLKPILLNNLYLRSKLLVRIMKAEGIPDHDGDTPNVLVECALIPTEVSEKPSATAVQENTFTPIFEELFEYHIDFEQIWKKKLHLVVWYVDAYFHLTSLGEVIYSLSQLDIEGFNISQTAMLFSKEIVLLHQTKVCFLI